MDVALHPTETVPVADLHPHPRNYRQHTDAQLSQIAASLQEHGVYRPVVTAKDLTILAGHGVVLAAKRLGLDRLPITRLDIEADSPAALKVVAGDNELARLAITDDRALADLLAEVAQTDPLALLGTGFTDASLAELMVLSHDEITSEEAAALWRGMPGFESEHDGRLHVTVNFRTEADRADFAAKLGIPVSELTLRFWWPVVHGHQDDARSVSFRG